MIYNSFKNSILITIGLIAIVILVQLVIKIIVHITSKLLQSLIGRKATWYVINILTFVGTIHHELCHTLFVILLGAKLHSITFFQINKYCLGKVTFSTRGSKVKRSLQSSLISMAPTIIGSIDSLIILFYSYKVESIHLKILLIYLGISILFHSTMSKLDIKVAKQGMLYSIAFTVSVIFIIHMIIYCGQSLMI